MPGFPSRMSLPPKTILAAMPTISVAFVWGFELWSRGFGVWGLGFVFWWLGFGVLGLMVGGWDLGFGVWDLGLGGWGLGLGVQGFEVWGLEFASRAASSRRLPVRESQTLSPKPLPLDPRPSTLNPKSYIYIYL